MEVEMLATGSPESHPAEQKVVGPSQKSSDDELETCETRILGNQAAQESMYPMEAAVSGEIM